LNLTEKDKNYIWHPFTNVKTSKPPISITHAKGCTLYAEDGREYIDAVSSWWVNIHGHANETIAKAIAEQALTLEHVIFAGFTHASAVNLAEQLLQQLPPQYSKVFFSDNGSTAVEVALKMALQYWYNQDITHKIKVIAFEDAYHGDTFGSMSLSGRNAFNAPFNPLLFEVFHLPLPTDENFKEVKKVFNILVKKGDVAAFIFEPLVQGAAGMRMYKAEYLDELVEIAQKNKVICIADEVMTGFGRTGKLFASDYLTNKPDIMCLSKGITGGFMALGVTICSHQIYETFVAEEAHKTFYHGHSYTANPLACAAANASFKLLLSENCQKNIDNISKQHKVFAHKIKNHPFIKNVRCTGTILAIEFKTAENSSYFNTIKDRAYNFYLENGVLLRPLGNVVYIMPPYCMTNFELSTVYRVIEKSVEYLSVL
jgi:adenosylmethionine---8-amino-7-oxononanoate aminotransferase